MRIAISALIGLAALAAMPVQAVAQTAADRGDVRCVLLLGAVASDPKQKESATQGTFYFLGRLDANVGSKLEGLLLEEGKAMNDRAKFQTELNRCAAQLQARNEALRAMYTRLQAAAPKPAPAPAPAKPPAK